MSELKMDHVLRDSSANLYKLFLKAVNLAAEIAEVPVSGISISIRDFESAIKEADRELAQIQSSMGSSPTPFTIGMKAGALAYWINFKRPVVVLDPHGSHHKDGNIFCDLATMIFIVNDVICHQPPQEILSRIAHLLRSRQFTSQSLGLVFDLIVAMGEKKSG